ncbi:collagen alpha-6(VI) chain [Pleurodeles waltl]|uniref:collagen alpha-6(VI) chain n=1 Tax=Pleurodeles waltl TaxID=8319 RepID=UPI0037093AD5
MSSMKSLPFFIFVWVIPSMTVGSAPQYADVVLLVDSSDNLGSKAFPFVKILLNRALSSLDLGADKYRAALAQYSDDIHTEFQLTTYKAKNPILNHIKKNVVFKGGSLRTGNALTKVHETIFKGTPEERDRKQFPKVLVVFTSGTSLDNVEQPALELRQDGVKIIAIGLQKASLPNLQAMASSSDLIYRIPSPKEIVHFSQTLSEIITNVSKTEYGIPTSPATRTAASPTTASTRVTGRPSTTTAGHIPFVSSTATTNTSYVNNCYQSALADIVFMVDESVSDTENFKLIQGFLHETINALDVKKRCMRIGLVMYSNISKVITSLGENTEKDDVLRLLQTLSTSYGTANTGAAINFTRSEVFSESKGSRKNQGIEQIAVLITHRPSNDSVIEAAQHLRRDGVSFFVIGVQDASLVQMTQMASHPPEQFVVDIKLFSNLTDLSQIFWKKISNEVYMKVSAFAGKTEIIQTACVDTEEADIYFLIDSSGSITQVDFQEMKTFLVEVVDMFNIGPSTVRVAAVQFSETKYISLEIKIDAYSNKKDLKLAIQNIRQIGGGTEIGGALNYMLSLIKAGSNSRRGKVPRYLIVLTDGESQDSVKKPAEMLRAELVSVYAIGVKEANKTQLYEIAGKDERVHFVENFDSLKVIKNKIVPQMCSNEACKRMEADIMFLVDGSGSIGEANFEKMKTFMRELVNKSDIGINKVQVGAVQFSDTNKEEFQMNKHTNKRDIYSAIDSMTALGQGTRTGEALKFVSDYFKKPKGGRMQVKQFLILITDGEAEDEVKEPATLLREAGIVIYSVGVQGANITQLEEISGKSKMFFYVDNFDVLKKIEDELLLGICSPYEDCKRIERADIVFVIDSSSSIDDSEYATMKEFMISLVNKSDVGIQKVQFGAIKYSNAPETIFYLNDYDTKSKVVEILQNDPHKGGDTYTANALRHSEMLFLERFGSRRASGVPQILFVLTDGESHDNGLLNGTAKRLRDSGIIIYAIGIDQANTEELMAMAGTSEKMFFVGTFDKLKEIYINVSEGLCNLSKPECEVKKADVVFLIDGSTSIGVSDFSVMKDFMTSVVAGFNTQPGMVHIGVAQYSDNYKEEFRLSPSSKDFDIKTKVGDIHQITGNTLIGRALELVDKSHFNPQVGSRINEGIQQLLLVITDGKSQDDVASAAEALRKKSINIYALGVGDVSDNQLLQIAGSPEKKFTINNFDELSSIKKRIVQNMCKEESKSNCHVDIVLGFDISTLAEGQMLLHGQSQLEARLPDILQMVTSLSTVSCSRGTNTHASLALHLKNSVTPIASKFQIYSKDILETLKAVKVKRPSRLDASTMRSLWATFQNQSNAEAKVIVIFTDGLDGDVEELEKVSEQLRKEGLSALITVVLEGTSGIHNISLIEFGRGFEYQSQLTIGMQDIGRRLFKALSHVSEKSCCCTLCKCIGDKGAVGTYGTAGQKGRVGLKGLPGHAGEEGAPGDRGIPGPEGEQGVPGCVGTKGPKGTRGMHGTKGDTGDGGIDGVRSEQGARGSPGNKGARGDPGYQGYPGIRGTPGDRGEKGFRGDPGESGADKVEGGPRGEKGDEGEKGDFGPHGPPGSPGSKGKSKVEGRKGILGPKGSNGAPGFSGDPGAQGIPGPEGNEGVRGETGTKGTQGLKGVPGAFGPEGVPGISGAPGPRGRKGLPGDSGKKGEPGQDGWHGHVGEDGRDGYGAPGRKGGKGQKGFPGYNGPKGDRGDSGLPGDAGARGSRGKESTASIPGDAGWPGARGPPGRMGAKGAKGQAQSSPCDLIEFIRTKCRKYVLLNARIYHQFLHALAMPINLPLNEYLASATSLFYITQHTGFFFTGKPACPVYPTELVFALDMSKDVTADVFRKMKEILLSVVSSLNIRESNCPTGARVAILSYNYNNKYLVRPSDIRSKSQLLTAVTGIPFERSSSGRNIGRIMRFVARNVFKRTLQGANVRKVAVFFSNGQSEDAPSIQTAVMEFSALDIVPVVIAFNSVPHVQEAFKLDTTGMFQILTHRARDELEPLIRRLQQCTLCYDRCKKEPLCQQDIDPPPKLGTDAVFLLDSFQNVVEDQWLEAKDLLITLIDNFDIAKQPKTAGAGDRVALVRLAAQGNATSRPWNPQVEFDLISYVNKNRMKRHIQDSVLQLSGPTVVGQTLKWAIDNMLSKVPHPRKSKILFVISAGESSQWDKHTLKEASLKAKCQGFAIFVISMGPHFNRAELEGLASHPVDHHLVQLGRLHKPDFQYASGFLKPFVIALKRGINKYPPAHLRTQCERTRF